MAKRLSSRRPVNLSHGGVELSPDENARKTLIGLISTDVPEEDRHILRMALVHRPKDDVRESYQKANGDREYSELVDRWLGKVDLDIFSRVAKEFSFGARYEEVIPDPYRAADHYTKAAEIASTGGPDEKTLALELLDYAGRNYAKWKDLQDALRDLATAQDTEGVGDRIKKLRESIIMEQETCA